MKNKHENQANDSVVFTDRPKSYKGPELKIDPKTGKWTNVFATVGNPERPKRLQTDIMPDLIVNNSGQKNNIKVSLIAASVEDNQLLNKLYGLATKK